MTNPEGNVPADSEPRPDDSEQLRATAGGLLSMCLDACNQIPYTRVDDNENGSQTITTYVVNRLESRHFNCPPVWLKTTIAASGDNESPLVVTHIGHDGDEEPKPKLTLTMNRDRTVELTQPDGQPGAMDQLSPYSALIKLRLTRR